MIFFSNRVGSHWPAVRQRARLLWQVNSQATPRKAKRPAQLTTEARGINRLLTPDRALGRGVLKLISGRLGCGRRCFNLRFQIRNVKAGTRLHRGILDEGGYVLRDNLCRDLEAPHLVLEGVPISDRTLSKAAGRSASKGSEPPRRQRPFHLGKRRVAGR